MSNESKIQTSTVTPIPQVQYIVAITEVAVIALLTFQVIKLTIEMRGLLDTSRYLVASIDNILEKK